MLKNFLVDQSRSQLVADVEFYQLNLTNAVKMTRKDTPDLFVEGDDSLPSWSKFAKDPIKAKGFWSHILQGMFCGQNNLDELNLDLQICDSSVIPVSMMFLSINNNELDIVVNLTKQILPAYYIHPISGRTSSNRKAEKETREVIETCQKTKIPILILASKMAQRSFSIPEITNLFLCYDEGSAGATTQKISRALTPSGIGKIGRIWSLSFDPNRDDKFDTMILASAQNYAKRKSIELDLALRQVIQTIDIFRCSPNGRMKIECDQYLQQLLNRDSLSRMIGQQADMSKLSKEEIISLASGNGNYDTITKTEKAIKGKIGAPKKSTAPRSKLSKEDLKLYDRARKTLTTICEHLIDVCWASNLDSIRDSLLFCEKSKDHRDYIITEFGISPSRIIHLFDNEILNYDLATLQVSAKKGFAYVGKN